MVMILKDHMKSWVGAKLGNFKYCGRGDILFLTYEYVTKWSCDFRGRFPLLQVLPSLVANALLKRRYFVCNLSHDLR